MLHIIWAILNLIILIYFFIICFKIIKITHQKNGVLSSIILILCLLSLFNNLTQEKISKAFELNKVEIKKNDLNTKQTNKKIILEKSWVNKFVMNIYFINNKNIMSVYRANSYIDGLVCGITWKPSEINVNSYSKNNEFSYDIIGIVEWKLIGIKLYAEPKSFSGIIKF